MNQKLEDLMYQSGLTAQGCWDSFDEYDRAAVEKFAQLIIHEYSNKPAAPQADPDAYGYASRLAAAIWEKHYKDIAPQWKPLDDVMGVLTQIDNMTAGLIRPAPPAAPSVPASQWIACSERMPDAGIEVLAFADEAMYLAVYEPKGWWWGRGHMLHRVTHWMPLPAAPSGGEK